MLSARLARYGQLRCYQVSKNVGNLLNRIYSRKLAKSNGQRSSAVTRMISSQGT